MSKMQNLNSPSRAKRVQDWIDHRLPVFTFMRHSLDEYPTPKNLSYWWNFGSLSLLCLVIMLVTGIFLAMYYTPHHMHAFDSVDRIMRDVNYGWLLRHLHMNGASMFFIVVYIHMFRGLYYGSYKSPRELLWIIGVVILLLMMATAFLGYVLPWGQMSFWGATVITKLVAALFPGMDGPILNWLWGDFSVSNATLNRFFSLHYLMPFVIIGAVVLHIIALHKHGSNNPVGIDLKSEDQIPFNPYYTIKDFFGFGLFFLFFFYFVFYNAEFFNEPDNYIQANPAMTPPHIVPEWYFLPYYAILRSIEWRWGGVFMMFASIMVLFALPWLDRAKVKSGTFRPLYKKFFWVFLVNCLILGYMGAFPPDATTYGISNTLIAQVCTFYYFAHFLIIIPLLGKYEKTRPLPESISKPVLGGATNA